MFLFIAKQCGTYYNIHKTVSLAIRSAPPKNMLVQNVIPKRCQHTKQPTHSHHLHMCEIISIKLTIKYIFEF